MFGVLKATWTRLEAGMCELEEASVDKMIRVIMYLSGLIGMEEGISEDQFKNEVQKRHQLFPGINR
jgi:hypothetical protein